MKGAWQLFCLIYHNIVKEEPNSKKKKKKTNVSHPLTIYVVEINKVLGASSYME